MLRLRLLTIALSAALVGCGSSPPEVENSSVAAAVESEEEAIHAAPAESPTPLEELTPSPATPSASPTSQPHAQPTSAPSEEKATASSSKSDSKDSTTNNTSGSTGVPQDLIDAMKADLAGRLGIATSQISVVSGRAVTWSDGSLECPEPGQSYTQALVDGYHVILAAGGREYDYRSDGTRFFKFCEHPSGGGGGTPVDR